MDDLLYFVQLLGAIAAIIATLLSIIKYLADKFTNPRKWKYSLDISNGMFPALFSALRYLTLVVAIAFSTFLLFTELNIDLNWLFAMVVITILIYSKTDRFIDRKILRIRDRQINDIFQFYYVRHKLYVQAIICGFALAFGYLKVQNSIDSTIIIGYMYLAISIIILPIYTSMAANHITGYYLVSTYEVRLLDGTKHLTDYLYENNDSIFICRYWSDRQNRKSQLEIRKDYVETISGHITKILIKEVVKSYNKKLS